jgi:hypothetical protein
MRLEWLVVDLKFDADDDLDSYWLAVEIRRTNGICERINHESKVYTPILDIFQAIGMVGGQIEK